MPTDETAPGEINITFSDWEALQNFFREFRELRRSHIDNAAVLLENCFKVNQASASFYEKLILLDGGTIALSLSLLGAHASGHIPKQAFYCLVCPAWVLLLFSILCSGARIAQIHNVDKNLAQQFAALSAAYYLQYFGILTTKFSKLTQGKIRIESEEHDFSSFMSGLAALITKTATETQKQLSDLVKHATEADESTSRLARLAVRATQAAFILLCVFAVRIVSLT